MRRILAIFAVLCALIGIVALGPAPKSGLLIGGQVKGSSISCAIGPNYTGIVPAPAAAANFNTCAANYDWTNTANFSTNGHSYNFSTISTWLDCAGSSFALLWRGSDGFGNIAPCGNASITTDGSTQVLQMTLSPADISGGSLVAAIETALTSTSGTTFPQQYYVEGKYREATPNSNAATGSLISDLWALCCTGAGYVEFDFIEMYAGGANEDTAGTNDFTQGFFPEVHHANTTLNPGYDHTNYHVFGERVTMDSSGNTSICFYVDGVQSTGSTAGSGWTKTGNCITGQWITPSNLNGRQTIILWNGNGNPSAPLVLSAPVTTYWQYVRVFDCSGWAAGNGYACANTPISSNP